MNMCLILLYLCLYLPLIFALLCLGGLALLSPLSTMMVRFLMTATESKYILCPKIIQNSLVRGTSTIAGKA
jgi:hypothetical protein